MEEWNEQQVTDSLNRADNQILYFFTPMCGTCQLAKKMLSVVEAMLAELPLASANLNVMPDKAVALKIESVPCLVILRNGRMEEKIYAFHSVDFLYHKLSLFQA